jgi:hypothetical protein
MASTTEIPSSETKSEGPRVTFKQLIVLGFKAELAIQELIAPSRHYRGRRDVIFAGVSAYAVQPNSQVARHAMQIKCLELYVKHCEAIALGKSKPAAAINGPSGELESASSTAWTPTQLQAFRNGVYDALGGQSIIKSVCVRKFREGLQHSTEQLALAHRVMEIWHVLVANKWARGEAGFRLKIELGCDLAHEIGYLTPQGVRKRPSSRTFQRAWKRCHKSIALSYAAKDIRIPRKGTILDLILASKLSYATAKPLVEQWFGRAKFVHEHLLTLLAKGQSENRFLDLSKLPVAIQSYDAPHFSRSDLTKIKAAYS